MGESDGKHGGCFDCRVSFFFLRPWISCCGHGVLRMLAQGTFQALGWVKFIKHSSIDIGDQFFPMYSRDHVYDSVLDNV